MVLDTTLQLTFKTLPPPPPTKLWRFSAVSKATIQNYLKGFLNMPPFSNYIAVWSWIFFLILQAKQYIIATEGNAEANENRSVLNQDTNRSAKTECHSSH